MKRWTLLLALVACSFTAFSQEEEEEIKQGGFKKENLFVGGSISLSFGNRVTLLGGSPLFGYRIADWVDAGIVANYNYQSFRHLNNDKERRNVYGGGVFTRLYPVNFLFAQGQFEHNFISAKYIYNGGQSSERVTTSANSFLVGAGFAQGRMNGFNTPFYYFSVLWDLSGNELSPYTDVEGKPRIILRAGINLPLFRP